MLSVEEKYIIGIVLKPLLLFTFLDALFPYILHIFSVTEGMRHEG